MLESFLVVVVDKIMDLCMNHLLNRSVSEQSFGITTPTSCCLQPVMAHPADQLATSFDELYLHQTDHSSKSDIEHWGKNIPVFIFVF